MAEAISDKELLSLRKRVLSLEAENQQLREMLSKKNLKSMEKSCEVPVSSSNPPINELVIQNKIRHKEELFRDLYFEALDGIVFWGPGGKIINANESACKIFELPLEELVKRKIDDFIYSKDEKYHTIVKSLQKNGAIRDELLFLMPNGQKKHLEFTSKLQSVDGYHMTIVRNVSERHQMEQELRKSEQRFRNIFEGSIEGMVLFDDQFKIIDINQSGATALEQSKSEIIGKPLSSLLINSNLSNREIEEKFETLRRDGKASGTLSIKFDHEKVKHFEYSLKYNLLDGLNLTVFSNITEKLELEEQLRKSDTLNVIGELAAGIAHEIRNPMTSLKGFIQLLQPSMKKEHTMYFQVITDELKRIDSIINEFLMLAKPQVVKFTEVDISQVMKETVNLLNAQAVLHDIQFKTQYDRNLPKIFCEPNQLKKVFINIIKNAIEAMPNGGFITVTINQLQGDEVKISIKDEGYGIPQEKLKKLGEPFYTTKDRGTGLGLMVSYKIIEEHKGRIKVKSSKDSGTVFDLFLPLKTRKERE